MQTILPPPGRNKNTLLIRWLRYRVRLLLLLLDIPKRFDEFVIRNTAKMDWPSRQQTIGFPPIVCWPINTTGYQVLTKGHHGDDR